jgi:hypothetical protein
MNDFARSVGAALSLREVHYGLKLIRIAARTDPAAAERRGQRVLIDWRYCVWYCTICCQQA